MSMARKLELKFRRANLQSPWARKLPDGLEEEPKLQAAGADLSENIWINSIPHRLSEEDVKEWDEGTNS